MKKISIIIRREYVSRVRKKSFIITTLLLPVGMALLMGAIIYFTATSNTSHTIGVIDETAAFFPKMDSNETYNLLNIEGENAIDKKTVAEKYNADILLHIYSSEVPGIDSIVTYTESSLSLKAKEYINSQINDIYRISLLENAGMDKYQIDSIQSQRQEIKNQTFDAKETNTEIAAALGYGMGFLMYMVIFIYGVGVMRGVMEEKTNRIAEVIVSSVTPFQLMMGKILGIALVGLTQFAMWVGLLFVLQFILVLFIPGLSPESMTNAMPNPDTLNAVTEMTSDDGIKELYSMVASQNWVLIIGSFFFYFLGGYLLYAALFAAVGSLVNEDPQDAQQLTMPITLPIVFAFVILATTADDPNSGLAVFGSIFPLTSPIVMLGRIPYLAPSEYWQIWLSMFCLVLGFVFTVWLSAKIYRIGILLYGKKVGWKEVIKWLRKA